MKRLRLLVLSLLTLALGGATCQGAAKPDPTPEADAGAPAPVDAGPPRPPTDPDALEAPTQEDLPGYPLDQVLSSTARQVLAFAKDNFSYDGCPTALQDCLRDPRYQRHALRVLDLATRLMAEGRSSAEVGTLLNRYYASFAKKERLELSLTNIPCRGPEGAKVTMVEFSDFECPACAAARPVLEAAVTQAGLVQLCYKPFPLAVHPHGMAAAQTALFARDHGHFWEMHDALFAHQDALESERLVSYATNLDMPGPDLVRALANNAYAAEVELSHEEGKRAGIKGTPALFLNGRPLVLPLGPDTLAAAVRDELEWQANGGRFAPDPAK